MNKHDSVVLVLAGLLLIAIFGSKYHQHVDTNSQTKTATSSPVSVLTLKPGDRTGEMHVVSIEPFNKDFGTLASNNVKAEFSGTVVIDGVYGYFYSEESGEWLLYFKASTTSTALPLVEERSPSFEIINQGDAIRLLKILPHVASDGSAKIKIQGYELNSYPAEVSDRSTIISVVQ